MIEGIYVTPTAGEPMLELKNAEVVAGRGIVGDRYFKREGTYSVFRTSAKHPNKREPGRHITLVAAEGVEEALLINGIPRLKSLGDFRRNVVLRGVPVAKLQAGIGREVRLGDEVVVFVHRWCVPCMYNERKNRLDGLIEATWDVAGVCCEVLRGGTIKVGDTVSISDTAELERVDGGLAQTDPNFLVRPSQRTKAMVDAARARNSAMLQYLLKVDPAGVVRGIESYETVGLQLFPKHKRFRRGEALEKRFCTMVGIFAGLLFFVLAMQRVQRLWDARPMVTRAWMPDVVCDSLPVSFRVPRPFC